MEYRKDLQSTVFAWAHEQKIIENILLSRLRHSSSLNH